MARQRSGSGGGWIDRQWPMQAPNSSSFEGKWRYSVSRVTPASSATALMEVAEGPIEVSKPHGGLGDALTRLADQLGAVAHSVSAHLR